MSLTYDAFSVHDDVSIEQSGRSYKVQSDGSTMIGDVQIIGRDSKGNTLFTKTEKNALLVNGQAYILEKINNQRCRFTPTPLDVKYGSHTQADVEISYETLRDEFVCGMVFGIGGCTNTYNTVKPVLRNSLTVPDMIPIRMVKADEDLSGMEREMYLLRKTTYIEGVEYAVYYGKRFNIEPRIDIVFESGDDVPNDVSKYETNDFIFGYTYYTVTVSASDIREYFKITDGNTSMSRINSIGLIAGYPRINEQGYNEFYNVRCLTTVNCESIELKDALSEIIIHYRWHVR